MRINEVKGHAMPVVCILEAIGNILGVQASEVEITGIMYGFEDDSWIVTLVGLDVVAGKLVHAKTTKDFEFTPSLEYGRILPGKAAMTATLQWMGTIIKFSDIRLLDKEAAPGVTSTESGTAEHSPTRDDTIITARKEEVKP